MMIDMYIRMSTDGCKALLGKYLGIDMCNFIVFINTNDDGDNVLILSSNEITMKFKKEEIKEIIIDLFDNDSSKINDVRVLIINNIEESRKYVSIDCKVSKDCIKTIVDIFR